MDIIDSPTWENGIFNVASNATLCISELEEFYGPINYGSYTYKAINVPTGKLKIHFPNVKIPPSKETLLDVLQNM